MKRFLSALLSFIIVIGTFFAVPYKESPFVIFASAANDGVLYEYNSATDSYIVTGLEDKAVTEIIIAESINGKPVTKIADSAFSNEDGILVVTIPTSITCIGTNSFNGCDALHTVNLNSNLAEICNSAFAGCKNLLTVNFAVNSVSAIGMNAFSNCIVLATAHLPEGLLSIDKIAFTNCISLNAVSVPSTLTSIGTQAFSSCENIATAYIKSIGSWCNVSLGSADASPVAWAENVYVNGHLIDEEISIPSGIEEIKDYAFYNLTGIKTVHLPQTVKSIGAQAFSHSDIQNITLNEGLESIGEQGFYACNLLTEITIPTTLRSIGKDCFYANGLLSIVNTTSLADWCKISFADEHANPAYNSSLYLNGTKLTQLNIPEGVEEIKPFAFVGFDLSSVTLPSTVKTICGYAFAACKRLTEITIPESVASIETYAFYNCSKVTDVTINTSTALIETQAFYNCSKLTNIHTPSITAWCGLTFESSSANLLSSGKKLYVNGELQKDIVIPEGVSVIKANNFAGYSEITSVSLSSTVHTIEGPAFANCPNIATLDVSDDNNWLCAVDSVIYSKDKTQLVLYPVCKDASKYAVENTVTGINQYAFYKNLTLTELVLPAGLTLIDSYATAYCSNLKYVYFLGDEAQWSDVKINASNTISSAYIHYGSDTHVESENWVLDSSFSCTNGKDGYYNKICEFCDYAFEKQTIPAGHAYDDNICIYCERNEYTYNVNNYGELTITKYNGIESHIRIPERINGYFVTYIGANAFKDNTKLASVYIPQRIRSIGDYAFYGCSSLTEITGAQGVKSIGERAFQSSALRSCTFINNVDTLGAYCFAYCSRLVNVEIPENITQLPEGAFYYCRSLQSCTFGEDFEVIGKESFGYCSSIVSLNVEDVAITTIGEGAFVYCTALKEFTITPSVTTIEEGAFESCRLDALYITPNSSLTFIGNKKLATSINNLYINNLSQWLSNVMFANNVISNPICISANLYVDGELATKLVIPEISASQLKSSAFAYCNTIQEVVISDGITEIGGNCFSECPNLKKVILGNGVKAIGQYAFSDSGLEEIYISQTVTTIRQYAFSGCENLEEISIPISVTSIGNFAFSDCTGLSSITLPSNIIQINESTFQNCTSLQAITIPEGVTTIGNNAFKGCSNLENITLPSTLKTISAGSFNNCDSIVEVDCPEKVTRIGDGAFRYCDSLTTIKFRKNITSLGDYVYADCDSLKYIFHELSWEEWNEKVLSGNQTTSASPVAHHYGALDHTPSDVWEYDSGFNCLDTSSTSSKYYRYKGCTNGICDYVFERVLLTPGHQLENNVCVICGESPFTYTVSNGNAIITGCTQRMTNLVIPRNIAGYTVTGIDASAFANNTNLISVEIHDGITLIGDSAFANCMYLSDIDIQGRDAEIYASAFYNTAYYNDKSNWVDGALYYDTCLLKLSEDVTGELVIKEGTTAFATGAFDGCTLLEKLVIPSSVQRYAKTPFSSCTALKTLVVGAGITTLSTLIASTNKIENIIFTDDVTTLPTITFSSYSNIKTITVGKGVTAIPNYYFRNMKGLTSVKLEGDITEIGNYAFYGCSALTDVYLPESITTMGTNAFYNCTSLENINIPSTLKTVESNTFYGCTKLKSITLPKSITKIDKYAFYKCSALESIELHEGITEIGQYAFYNCKGLTQVNLPNSLTVLGKDAFYGCEGITEITIPNSITSLDAAVFQGCKGLVSITLPQGLTTIGESAFRNCTSLKSITIPEGVTALGSSVFRGNTALEELVIPDSVTSIGTYFITSCTGLKRVVIGDGVTNIDSLFKSNKYIENIVIGDGVASISATTFSGCTALKTVSIGRGVSSLPAKAFSTNTAMEYVYVPSSVRTIDNTAFTDFTGTIICVKDSPIHTFAEANSIPYILTELKSEDKKTTIYEQKGGWIFTELTSCNSIENMLSASDGVRLELMPTEVTGNIGTGAKVRLWYEACLLTEYTVAVFGDLNGDSVCDALDAALVGMYSTGLKEPTQIEIFAANGRIAIDADDIDVYDYQRIVNRAIA